MARRASIDMFKKFRRNSKTSQAPDEGQPSRASSIATVPKTCFFNLPAEIRNDIYERVAQGVTLRLHAQRYASKSLKKRFDPIPSLLVTSRQCRSEYLPIILSLAVIQVSVVDFDFSSITRITGSLFPTELKALRQNGNLILALHFTPAAKYSPMEQNIRRWATHRSIGLDRLPWRYRLGADRSSAMFVVNYHRCMAILKVVRAKVDESLVWEINRIMDVVETPAGSEAQFGGEYREWEERRMWNMAT